MIYGMIAKLRGVLEALEKDRALIQADGGLSYEVLLPSAAVAHLADQVGKAVTLHIHHYVEAPSQGSTMIPRLAGFLTSQDKHFFELLTTCKGIGPRKGLRAMALETPVIAAAIADRDLATLQSLPEIGRRTAETIVTDLRDKVAGFVAATAFAGAAGAKSASYCRDGAAGALGTMARDALEVLLQLGESRLEAVALIDRVLAQVDRPRDAQELVARVYELKSR